MGATAKRLSVEVIFAAFRLIYGPHPISEQRATARNSPKQ
jgi:hypothetical protein